MSNAPKIISVFISHPKDAQDQARAVRDACQRMEQTYSGKILFKIFDYDFETSSGGSPQDEFDRILKQSDIFIALVNKSLGSGLFVHEIKLALSRIKDKNDYFDNRCFGCLVTTEEGKAKLIKEFGKDAFLYSDFSPEAVILCLQRPLGKLFGVPTTSGQEYRSQGISETSKSSVGKKINLPVELENVFDVDLSKDPFLRLRLAFFSQALVSRQDLPNELISNHFLHLIYQHADRLKPTEDEGALIFKNLLVDEFQFKVGWFWLHKMSRDAEWFRKYAKFFLLSNFTEEIKIGALKFLTLDWDIRDNDYFVYLLAEESPTLLKETLLLMKDHGVLKKNLADKLIELQSHDYLPVSDLALDVYVSLVSKKRPHAAIKLLIQNGSREKLEVDKDLLVSANRKELDGLILHKSNSIKEQAYAEIDSRGLVDENLAKQMLEGENWEVRFLALKFRIEKGLKIDKDDFDKLSRDKPLFSDSDVALIENAYYSSLTKGELEEMLRWHSVQGHFAFQELYTRYFGEYSAKLIACFKDNFAQFREELISGYSKEILKEFEPYETFLLETFLEAAISVLLKKGSKHHVCLVEKYLFHSNKNIRKTACGFIKKFGQKKYALIFSKSVEKFGDDFMAEAALDFNSSHQTKITNLFLSLSDNSDVIRITIRHLVKKKVQLSVSKLLQLLSSENTSVRQSALSYIGLVLPERTRVKILARYQSGIYYYDVVSSLDRINYGLTQVKIAELAKMKKRMSL